jgi:hypothetical protein
MLDGSWHHVEIHIDFAGFTTTFKWNGDVKVVQTFDPGLSNWNRHIYWMMIFGAWTTCCPGPADGWEFTRQVDELEIWDGWPGPDTTPPERYSSVPGSLPAGTTQYNVQVTTNESANCRMSTVQYTAYADMTNDFDTTGGSSHSELVTGLVDGGSYNYYVRCQDFANPPNANPDDYLIAFDVLEAVSDVRDLGLINLEGGAIQ